MISKSNIEGIGIDLAEAKRFRSLIKQKKMDSLRKLFSQHELDYCLSYKDPGPHLAGTFAAKEAIQKALGDFSCPPAMLEIRRNESGKPEVWHKGKHLRRLLISISHSVDTAVAIAFKQ